MRHLCALLLSATLLGGCASAPQDPSGIWINQAAIDDAAEGGPLREALLAYGPNLEWQIDTQRQVAIASNGFELDEGQLHGDPASGWQVDFYGDFHERLNLEDDQLVQVQSASSPQQRFVRATRVVAPNAPQGSSFEHSLYAAYLGGTWTITEGSGRDGLVRFHPDGQVEGLPGADRYALCLAGDCAAMSGAHDGIWLQLGEQGRSWLFEREGADLRVFEALNQAAANEMPDYRPGQLVWRLHRN
ncbi:hypothetical protein NVV93_19500 [Pseudomonas sp. LS44]|uniref:hypothetical protein n=1 Tax=Pseudomonas sp. LS44 TaxID=1357074 RepID=UPI00215B5069|nr:hypothetical protein [Pseudomonas sp. LS44]UVE17715.1 hypothetical protein NVV93_19500 [Pseudomonas sp. LS44]